MTSDLVSVLLQRVPVRLAVAAREHFEELSREFLHLANSDESIRADVPGRLLALSADLRARFGAFTSENERRIDQAAERGDETIDLTYAVPPAAGAAALELGQLLDEADRFCATGEYLLTLQTPPDQVAYRKWYIGQFVAQTNGHPPVAFDERQSEHR